MENVCSLPKLKIGSVDGLTPEEVFGINIDEVQKKLLDTYEGISPNQGKFTDKDGNLAIAPIMSSSLLTTLQINDKLNDREVYYIIFSYINALASMKSMAGWEEDD